MGLGSETKWNEFYHLVENGINSRTYGILRILYKRNNIILLTFKYRLGSIKILGKHALQKAVTNEYKFNPRGKLK